MRGRTMKGKFVTHEQVFTWMERERGLVVITERAQKKYHHLLPSHLITVKTAKELFFSPWEAVYRYTLQGKTWVIEEKVEHSSFPSFLVLLPCEAKAILEVTDVNFMTEDTPDLGYARRRRGVTLIIVGCERIEQTCFCSLVGCSPFWRHRESVFLFPWKGHFYLEDGEEKLSLSPFEDPQKAQAVETFFAETICTLPLPLPANFPEKLYAHFDDPLWQKMAWHCVNCGACTYLCPTCYCFDLSVDGKLRGLTLHTWDSCMFPKFTLHASSHNPRPTGKERVRQRVMHKFSYFPLRNKYYGCVGCGVCREICPVNWDIKEVVEGMVRQVER